ncbi:MAG TPA: protocatechuate 3,4-dioxygenase [Sphingomicrobium sp.]|nr:protocatechuate 3,4-dioxygenase [Sphingomicrobium sp.]
MQVSRRQVVIGSAALIGLARAGHSQLLIETSDQDLGPFYPVKKPSDTDADLTRLRGARAAARGEPINVIGRILDIKGNPVRGARVEIWQANSFGRYDHPGDAKRGLPSDPNFQGYALLKTDRQGHFRFRTIRPGLYARRTRHIHFDVQGHNERLITQMYFPGEARNQTDEILRTADEPNTLIARRIQPLSGDFAAAAYAWDIVLAEG